MTKDKQIEEMAKLLHLNYDMPLEFAEGLAEFLIEEGYRKASDVAREIFEEIEKFMSPYRYPIIADLKKKYTEDGE